MLEVLGPSGGVRLLGFLDRGTSGIPPPPPESALLDPGMFPPPDGGEVLLLSNEVSVFVEDLVEGPMFSSVAFSWSRFLLLDPKLPELFNTSDVLSFFISVIDPKFDEVVIWKASILGKSADLDLLK